MIPNSTHSSFEFNFPRKFIPDHIVKKYKPYLNRIPGNLITEPIDYINYSIQSITVPGFSYDPVEQNQKPGINKKFRSSLPEQELLNKEFIVSFQLIDGFINYWILLETLFYYYSFENPNTYIGDMNLRFTDSEGNVLITTRIQDVLMTEIDDLQVSFASNQVDFTTFNITFAYNKLDVIIENN